MRQLALWFEKTLQTRYDVTASLVFALLTLPILLIFLGMPMIADTDPEWRALYNWEAVKPIQWLLSINSVILTFVIIRSSLFHSWRCPYGVLPLVTVGSAFSAIFTVCFGYGYHDSPLLILLVGMIIIVRFLFRRRIYNPFFILVTVAFVGCEVLYALDAVPYAPLLSAPTYQGGDIHPWWGFWLRLLYILIVSPILLMFFLLAYIILGKHKRLNELVRTDELTGLMNRRAFMERLNLEVHRNERVKESLCILLCDVDHFKKVNDKYGHAAGDMVLRQLGDIMQRSTRGATDFAARFGGEEFVVLLCHTELADAKKVAEHIAWQLRNTPFESAGKTFSVTISIGAVEVHDADVNKALHYADSNLYSAKASGRDKIVASDLTLNPSV